jgi:hypothetical protein
MGRLGRETCFVKRRAQGDGPRQQGEDVPVHLPHGAPQADAAGEHRRGAGGDGEHGQVGRAERREEDKSHQNGDCHGRAATQVHALLDSDEKHEARLAPQVLYVLRRSLNQDDVADAQRDLGDAVAQVGSAPLQGESHHAETPMKSEVGQGAADQIRSGRYCDLRERGPALGDVDALRCARERLQPEEALQGEDRLRKAAQDQDVAGNQPLLARETFHHLLAVNELEDPDLFARLLPDVEHTHPHRRSGRRHPQFAHILEGAAASDGRNRGSRREQAPSERPHVEHAHHGEACADGKELEEAQGLHVGSFPLGEVGHQDVGRGADESHHAAEDRSVAHGDEQPARCDA